MQAELEVFKAAQAELDSAYARRGDMELEVRVAARNETDTGPAKLALAEFERDIYLAAFNARQKAGQALVKAMGLNTRDAHNLYLAASIG